MGVLIYLGIGLMTMSAIVLNCVLGRWRPPVPAVMVLDEMAEQRAAAVGLPCRCVIYLLPDGDSYVEHCRRHSYMRNPDFAAWLAELDSR